MNWISTTKQSSILEGHYEMLNPFATITYFPSECHENTGGRTRTYVSFFLRFLTKQQNQYTDFNLAAEIEKGKTSKGLQVIMEKSMIDDNVKVMTFQ